MLTRISVSTRVAVLCFGVSGCSVGYDLTLYRPIANPVVRPAEDVQLFSGDEQPKCTFTEVGSVSTDGQYGNADATILAGMRKRVGEAGADGVVRLRKGGVGTIGEGRWEGVLFVCK